MVKKVTDNNMDEALSAGVAFVDFSATWCGPCQMLAPVVEELSEEMPEVSFYQVDVDANEKLAEQFQIMSVPSLLVFREGNPVAQSVGFQPKEALKQMIQAQMA